MLAVADHGANNVLPASLTNNNKVTPRRDQDADDEGPVGADHDEMVNANHQ